jgi:hypothetical protein
LSGARFGIVIAEASLNLGRSAKVGVSYSSKELFILWWPVCITQELNQCLILILDLLDIFLFVLFFVCFLFKRKLGFNYPTYGFIVNRFLSPTGINGRMNP